MQYSFFTQSYFLVPFVFLFIAGIVFMLFQLKKWQSKYREMHDLCSRVIHDQSTVLNAIRNIAENRNENNSDISALALQACKISSNVCDSIRKGPEPINKDRQWSTFQIKDVFDVLSAIFQPVVDNMKDRLAFRFQCATGKDEYFVGDQSKIVQVLTNLINNAIKASASKPQSVITCSLDINESTDQMEWRVADNGDGFESKNFVKGQGLGLKNSIALAQMMNGELNLEHSSKLGSTLLLSCPLQRAEGSSTSHDPLPREGGLLLLDDDDLNRELVARICAQQHVPCWSARNCDEFIALYKAHRQSISMLLVDHILDPDDKFDTSTALLKKIFSWIRPNTMIASWSSGSIPGDRNDIYKNRQLFDKIFDKANLAGLSECIQQLSTRHRYS